MTAINKALQAVTLGEAQSFENLQITPLLASAQGSADQAVFLLDGEELVGAKQNRILNLTLLVPAKTRMEIPVSCVEQGRWSHRSEEFAPTERTFFSKGRARKAARVSENLREGGYRDSNHRHGYRIQEAQQRSFLDDVDDNGVA